MTLTQHTNARRKRSSPIPRLNAEDATLLQATGRACHDCGRLTYDYRCPDCLARWRTRHHVDEDALGEQEWWAL
jgi:hypothetical protein